MAKKIIALSLSPQHSLGARKSRSEKKRRAMQDILDSMPEQIDAIKRERQNAAVELRRFIDESERDALVKRINAARLKRGANPVNGFLWGPEHTVRLSPSVSGNVSLSRVSKQPISAIYPAIEMKVSIEHDRK